MAKLLIMSGVDISEQGLILVTDEGLISSFPHTGGKKKGGFGEMEVKGVDN